MSQEKLRLKDFILGQSSKRELRGVAAKAVVFIAIGISLYHLYIFTLGRVFESFHHYVIHLTSLLLLGYLIYAFTPRKATRVSVVDLILAVSCLATGIYFILNTERFYDRVHLVSPVTNLDLLFSVILLVAILDIARRATGIWLPAVTVAFLLYGLFADRIPGIWQGSAFSLTGLIDILFLYPYAAMWGTPPIGVSSTYIILFVIFGQFFLHSGGGQFFTSFAASLLRKASGGPAKVAVISSGLFGMMTSASSANVATTGSFTIPMMKKIGFKAHVAGAIEATASTGGMFTPPIMAGVVFLASEFTGVPYVQFAIAAAIPALLYYLCIFMQVHFTARREEIKAAGAEIEPLKRVLKASYFFLPLIVVVVVLIEGYTPIMAALYGMAATVVVSMIKKETRMGLSRFKAVLADGPRIMTVIVASIACAAIIMGISFQTGLASKIVTIVLTISGGELFAVLLVAMIACLFLGLALPLIISYVLAVLLVVPAAVAAGVSPVAAHLFGIYYSCLAVITPPAGGTFFVAASLAGAPPMRVGWTATKFAIAGFLVPFLFVYLPGLLMAASPGDIALSVILSAMAIFFLASGIEGWLLTGLKGWQRLLLISGALLSIYGAVALLYQELVMRGIVLVLIALAVTALVVILQLREAAVLRGQRLEAEPIETEEREV
jgi:TRAP transporter 4TM/12TM fusion protein